MKLLKVELTRLRWRRAVVLLLAAAVVLPILFFAGTAWESRPYSDSEISDARAQMAENRAYMADDLKRCAKHPGDYGVSPDVDPKVGCEQSMMMDDDISNYLWREPLTLPSVLSNTGSAVAVFMVILALMLGTTYAGADWATGSMSNQLLFESRRPRVWFAKATATLIGGAILAVVGIVVFWVLIAGLAAYRDVGATGGQWVDVLQQGARVTGFSAAAAVGGFAITMLFRSTVATLGLMLAAVVGGSLLIELLPIDNPTPWTFYANAMAILQGGFVYYSDVADQCTDFECVSMESTLGAWHGTAYFAVLLLIICALSITSFRRRDVP